jgi:hypothetical protein
MGPTYPLIGSYKALSPERIREAALYLVQPNAHEM